MCQHLQDKRNRDLQSLLEVIMGGETKGRYTLSVPCPCRSPAMPFVNSHMPCRTPAMLQQCRVLRESPRCSRKYPNCKSNSLTDRLYCSVLLTLFTVVGMNRCEEEWYASDNNLRGPPRGSRKKPNAGR